ncbi:MAG: hypothetical protein HKN33_14385 [Pyrinomonadaceae bacterium]|nr:hypothetical protein [Pyrinomonadaceae bacterium]
MISNKALERISQIFAAALIATAVYFYLVGNTDLMFVAAVVGSVCFFVGIRFQVKERLAHRERNRVGELGGADQTPAAENQFENEFTE